MATMTSKGQITVPKEVRDALGLKAGTKVSFVRDESGGYSLRAKTRSIRDLAGIVKYDGPPVSVEQMNEDIAAAILQSWDDA